MKPTTLQELVQLLSNIIIEHGGETPVEFQDYDGDGRNVEIVLVNEVNYSDDSDSSRKLCIRYL